MSTSTEPSATPGPPLRPLGTGSTLRQYLADTWQRREFAWTIAVGNLRSQHLDTVLGNVWHVINPMLLLGVYYLVFGIIVERTSEGVDNFIGFLAVGIFVYNYSQRSISNGANSIVSNVGLIRSLQFPRALLPLSSVLQQVIAMASSVAVMMIFLLVTGESPRVQWLMFLPIFVLATLFNFGGALVVARLTDQVRDLTNVLPYIFRLLFYMSGILFSVDRFVTDERLRTLFLFNPFYDFVSLSRHYLMSSHDETNVGLMWLAATSITLVTFLAGFVFFRSGETRYGRG